MGKGLATKKKITFKENITNLQIISNMEKNENDLRKKFDCNYMKIGATSLDLYILFL